MFESFPRYLKLVVADHATSQTFRPAATPSFALSRSKLELFMQCLRCFYLNRRLGISRASGFAFNLNSAVDTLLKSEFDVYRGEGTTHPLMAEAGINAIPHTHPELGAWRNNFKGVRTTHEETYLQLFGAIDDLWRDIESGELIVVDDPALSHPKRGPCFTLRCVHLARICNEVWGQFSTSFVPLIVKHYTNACVSTGMYCTATCSRYYALPPHY
jgi:hypothetical protein